MVLGEHWDFWPRSEEGKYVALSDSCEHSANRHHSFLGSFGAIIAIVALALGPFAQQVVTYQTRTVSSLEGASVNRALNYTGALPGNTSPSKSPIQFSLNATKSSTKQT